MKTVILESVNAYVILIC